MAKQIRTEIAINAEPSKVWQVLINFHGYPNWNSFIKSIHGNPEVGHHLRVELVLPGKEGMTLKPKVLKSEENKEFRWKGRLIIPGLFDGEHIFELVDNKNGTTQFIHREEFKGLLVPLLLKMIGDNTKQGFEEMNKSLKKICEENKN